MITPVKIFSIRNKCFRILYHYRYEKIVHTYYKADWIVRHESAIGIGVNYNGFRWFFYKKLNSNGIFYRHITICGLAAYMGNFVTAGPA